MSYSLTHQRRLVRGPRRSIGGRKVTSLYLCCLIVTSIPSHICYCHNTHLRGGAEEKGRTQNQSHHHTTTKCERECVCVWRATCMLASVEHHRWTMTRSQAELNYHGCQLHHHLKDHMTSPRSHMTHPNIQFICTLERKSPVLCTGVYASVCVCVVMFSFCLQ